jgi:glucan phosphorylase
LQFIKELIAENMIGPKLIFSTSEVNTTLVIPAIVNDEFKDDPCFKNIFVHHYNHTIVPAGLHRYHSYMFEVLKIADEFKAAKGDVWIDLVKLTGMISNIITGCSSGHTRVLREVIFKEFMYKVVEDDFFGNSEGAVIERWQGEPIKAVISRYLKQFGIDRNNDLFWAYQLFSYLNADLSLKLKFITELSEAKKQQKLFFIQMMNSGVFNGHGTVTCNLDEPIATNIRRLVDYKCSNWALDGLINDIKRKVRFINSALMLVLGGRPFGSYGEGVKDRVACLLNEDKELSGHLAFIPNHNVFTSGIIQAGTDLPMMMSWKDKEAGPTSPTKAGQNFSVPVTVLDGVMSERLGVVHEAAGRLISDRGFIVRYEEQPDSSNNEVYPNMESFITELEAASDLYRNDRDTYNAMAYRFLEMSMTKAMKLCRHVVFSASGPGHWTKKGVLLLSAR